MRCFSIMNLIITFAVYYYQQLYVSHHRLMICVGLVFLVVVREGWMDGRDATCQSKIDGKK